MGGPEGLISHAGTSMEALVREFCVILRGRTWISVKPGECLEHVDGNT